MHLAHQSTQIDPSPPCLLRESFLTRKFEFERQFFKVLFLDGVFDTRVEIITKLSFLRGLEAGIVSFSPLTSTIHHSKVKFYLSKQQVQTKSKLSAMIRIFI